MMHCSPFVLAVLVSATLAAVFDGSVAGAARTGRFAANRLRMRPFNLSGLSLSHLRRLKKKKKKGFWSSVEKDGSDAVKSTEKATEKVGKDVETGAEDAGKDIETGTEDAVHETEKGVETVCKDGIAEAITSLGLDTALMDSVTGVGPFCTELCASTAAGTVDAAIEVVGGGPEDLGADGLVAAFTTGCSGACAWTIDLGADKITGVEAFSDYFCEELLKVT